MDYHRIFISYRRAGGDIPAKLVSEALKNRGYTTFYDYDALKGGTFDDRIRQEIIDCTDMILVLPPKALDRCGSERDWVRLEIALALQYEKNIIPVMLGDFDFPTLLPPDIDKVRYYNGVRFHMEFFDAVIDRIIEKLSVDPSRASHSSHPTSTETGAERSTPKSTAPKDRKVPSTPAPEPLAPDRTKRRERLTVCITILCMLFAAFLILGLFFLSSQDIDLATMCLLTATALLYVGSICAILGSEKSRRQRLLLILIPTVLLDGVMLILGFSVKWPTLMLCEAPYILLITLLGVLMLLCWRFPENSPYVSSKIKLRKKSFLIAFSILTVLAALILFLLVFTLGFYSDLF